MFNLKFLKALKESMNPKVNLLAFSEKQRMVNEDYIKSLSGTELKIKAEEQRLEAMVRQQLKEEFPNIEKSSSYDLLVDAVIHNYKAKQLQSMDEAAKKAGKVGVISCGWDPGMFSLKRLYANCILPEGKNYIFWGKGIS